MMVKLIDNLMQKMVTPVKYAISKGYRIAIISGGMQENVRKRLNSLGVEDVFLKAFDKIGIFEKFINDKNIKA